MKRISERLGTPVQDCLLVGDHLIDMTCAQSSSAKFVGVLTGAFGQEDWDHHGCVEVIDSVRSLPELLQGDK